MSLKNDIKKLSDLDGVSGFENNISNSYIKIYGANERLINIYESVLKRYDYKTCFNERKRKYLMKFIRGKKK